jgi:SCY1-like protein 1
VTSLGHLIYNRYLPPELEKSQGFPNPIHSLDMWAFACLVYQLFNNSSNSSAFSIKGKIPDRLFLLLKNCVHSNPRLRTDFIKFLAQASMPGGYFDHPLISTSIFLENFTIKEKEEKEQFLSDIESTVQEFPIAFSKFKILPELLITLEFGGAGSKALKPILTIGSRLSSQDFNELVIPNIIKLFSSTDRAIRLALCEKIDSFVDHLTEKIANDTIYTNLISGFNDTTAIIREQTLKAVAALSPKLTKKTINESLIRYLTKLQADPEPGIRTVSRIN